MLATLPLPPSLHKPGCLHVLISLELRIRPELREKNRDFDFLKKKKKVG